MKKALFAVLCVTAVLLWGAPAANAGALTWTVLTHASLAGKGPGPDELIGTTDDTTTGEFNSCNFTTASSCATTGSPTIGSYSYASVEMDGDVTHSCLGGDKAGAPCVCADLVTPCTEDAQCPGALCSPADCCPGGILTPCIACAQDDPPGEPFGPPKDTYTYGGSSQTSSGTLTTCQEADPVGDTDPPTDFEFTAVELAGSEAIPGIGEGCSRLKSGGPYLASPCTGNGSISGSFDVETFILGCTVPGGTIDNQSLSGDIIDITDPNNPDPATASCGYTNDELKTIAGHAVEADANAKHLMIICGGATLPDTATTACTQKAITYLVWVFYTADDASQCPDNDCQ